MNDIYPQNNFQSRYYTHMTDEETEYRQTEQFIQG